MAVDQNVSFCTLSEMSAAHPVSSTAAVDLQSPPVVGGQGDVEAPAA